MPDGMPSRPSVPPDLLHLLQLMQVRSEVVEMRLADRRAAPPAIEELPPAVPSVLDKLVEARVREEEKALTAVQPEPQAPERTAGIDEEATPQMEAEAAEPAEPAEDGEDALDPELDLLELNAAEAGQPADVASYEPPVAPEFEVETSGEPELVEEGTERDELLEPAELRVAAPQTEVTQFEPNELAADEAEPESVGDAVDPRDDLVAIEADLARMEADLAQYEELTQAEPAEPEAELEEGSGQDFQALLAGARSLEPESRSSTEEDKEEFPYLPADGDVKLRARNGPRPGAEFVGKSTLAGSTGLFCLIHGFNLPLGTRMKVSLIAPDFADQKQVDDAVVSRLRKAPDNATEVQLTFDAPHEDFEEFVAQHFGKPSFSLFGRRRPKR